MPVPSLSKLKSHTNPRRETFVQESLRQVRQIIIQLRNHPSIIVWAAFAEARMGGKGWGVGEEDWEQYGYVRLKACVIGEVEVLFR
jgi:beta-galactosidase/beta-glucuronidase